MAVTIKVLVPGKYAENTQTTQYTAMNCKAIIDKATAVNVTALNATISVNIVASGGSASNANVVTITRTIAPSDTYRFPELVGHNLESGGFISTISSAASAISFRMSGREIT